MARTVAFAALRATCRLGISGPVNLHPDDAAIHAIERPHRSLWTYYALSSLVVFPLIPFILPYYWFRFHSMRYKFTDEGISMSWGILFRRQIIINYARIQDIHLRSNLVERWLGLARVLVQTASGSSGAEMTLEGLQEFEAVRDFLYSKMRGVKDQGHRPAASAATGSSGHDAELAAALREVARELRETRAALTARASGGKDSGHV
jgi:putative membrane protein